MSNESTWYIIQSVVFNSLRLGHPCFRERRLTWLFHKRMVKTSVPPTWAEPAVRQFYRSLDCDYHIYAVATEDELEEELQWCESREGSMAQVPSKEIKLPPGSEHVPTSIINSRYFKALLASEQERLVNYWLELANMRTITGKKSRNICAGIGQDCEY